MRILQRLHLSPWEPQCSYEQSVLHGSLERLGSVARITLLTGLTLLALPLGIARAESPSQAALEQRIEVLRERAERDAEQEVTWREWHQKLLKDVEDARVDLENKKQAHYALRRRKWRAGRSRAEYSRDIEEARRVLKATQKKLDEFYLRARRQGIPPGWLRPLPPAKRASASPAVGANR